MKTNGKTKTRRVHVLSAPSTHWGTHETKAWAQIGPKSIDVVIQDPACLTTAPLEQMTRQEGTKVVLRLTHRQIATWLKEGVR